MINIEDKTQCSGCFACASKCPKDAITMKEDDYGFKYPVVDKSKCINCGLCDRVCPIINNKEINNEPSAYACINKNENIRMKSSSGGIFTLIAEYILSQNGIVFGAAFNDLFEVEHISIEKIEELEKLRTSKYLQSSIGNSYKEAKTFLDEGRKVLFTGTPCQIEGLKRFLNNEYENLYTQDIICHGVPSPKVWKRYINYRRNSDKDILKKVNFRNKEKGWKEYSLKLVYSNKCYSKTQKEEPYMRVFLSNLCLRDSCYACSFKKYNRISDLTLADFWGIDNIDKTLNDDKGTSLVIVNSNKGKKLFDYIKSSCIIKEVDLDEAIKYNKSFISSAGYNKNREGFFKELDNKDFIQLVKKYVPQPSLLKRCVRKVKRVIKKIIKR